MKAYLGKQFTPPGPNIKELKKDDLKSQKPLIYPFHVYEALVKAEEVFSRYPLRLKDETKRNKRLREAKYKETIIHHMINLGFQLGIRVSEFTNLKIQDVIYDGGISLYIRASKTENGIRIVPLYLLATDRYIEVFSEYYKNRRNKASCGVELLFPDYKGDRWDSSHLSSESIRLFKKIGIQDMRFHYLRHGFANWFLLRWFCAFHKEYVPEDLPVLENDIFHEPYISRLSKLFLGMNGKKGQEFFTFALAVLAKLIGHGGPIVTLKNYIHTVDWIFYMLSKKSDDINVQITSRQAEELLQLSYHTLPSSLKGRYRKILKFKDILHYQKKLIKSKRFCHSL